MRRQNGFLGCMGSTQGWCRMGCSGWLVDTQGLLHMITILTNRYQKMMMVTVAMEKTETWFQVMCVCANVGVSVSLLCFKINDNFEHV
ncbi:hypothetical protein F4775DRAFT_577218 [Biscogniauxia sp. FL1348]|nr:hypothetical protein F4775DRAFT_577218 [Biscogniauxia sp. FL1348]